MSMAHLRALFSDPKTCLVSAPYLGETLSLKWCCPVVVSLLRCLSFYGLLRFIHCGNLDVVPCFVALCPPVVMEILDGFLYLLLENHFIQRLYSVLFYCDCKLQSNSNVDSSPLIQNKGLCFLAMCFIAVLSASSLYALLLLWIDAYGSVSETIWFLLLHHLK
ncbi:hypothetical protein Tco_0767498 [Tanacetum coccineum]